jgi:hypothetical protein
VTKNYLLKQKIGTRPKTHLDQQHQSFSLSSLRWIKQSLEQPFQPILSYHSKAYPNYA